jgi:hypothetical protein
MASTTPTAASPDRRALTPSSAIPLAYFTFAHAGLALACLALVLDPGLPGAFFYHPRMVALVHLVTIVWLSGSILGAFYIVAPLALRLPMTAGRMDWIAFASFVLGATGMVTHFWIAEYNGMAWSAGLVVTAIGWVGARAWRGLPRSAAPWPIALHVALAFFNIVAAAILGIVLGIARARGTLHVSPLAMTFAHAHLAALGWVTMMVVGLAYRLIPMMVPAPMPTGRSLALSAVLLQIGLTIVVVTLIWPSTWLSVGALTIAAGLASFAIRLRRAIAHRLPRPPALPRRDWSTWQAHAALLWLLVAVALGVALSVRESDAHRIALSWCYGVAGLLGFLAQIVVGIQGRLIPLYAWYRSLAARGGTTLPRAANELPSAAFARAIFVTWLAGVPALACGLAAESRPLITIAAALLFCGVVTNGVYAGYLFRKARGV